MDHLSSNIEQNKRLNFKDIFGPDGFDADKYASNDDQPRSSSEALREATNVLEDHGLFISGLILADGAFHKLNHKDDKKGKNKGYYSATIYPNGHVYMNFGTWNDRIPRQNWSSRDKYSHQMTEAERAEHQKIYKETQERLEAEIKRRHDQAAKKASAKLSVLPLINSSDTHPYLEAKGIKALGDVRINGGKLIIPMRDSQTWEVTSLQTIDHEGVKSNAAGGKAKGSCFFIHGKPDEIAVCEGYATGCSIHEATGASVFVAFSRGNLNSIAQAARRCYENSNITIYADNDCFNSDGTKRPQEKNPGIMDGLRAAEAINAICIWPNFKGKEFDQNGKRRTDFNDLHKLFGLPAITRTLSRARNDPSNQEKFTERFEVYPASIFCEKEAPKREWIWEGVIPRAQTTIIYADGGVGKTLLAQQLQTAVASGKTFLGQTVSKGVALGVYCEDSKDELHRRQEDINRAMRVSPKDITDSCLSSRVGSDNLLITFSGGDSGSQTKFWNQLYDQVEELKPILVIIDTAADTFGGNENIRSQVRQYIQRCLTHIAVDFNCAVVLCAHPSAAGMASEKGDGGSTAWSNSVRSRAYLTRNNDTGIITLEVKKANYAKTGSKFEMVWVNGAFVTCTELSFDFVDQERKKNRDDIDALFLGLLDEFEGRGQSVSQSRQGNYAPNEFYKIVLGRDLKWSKKELEEAMSRLFDAGEIELVEKTKSRSKKITRKQHAKPTAHE